MDCDYIESNTETVLQCASKSKNYNVLTPLVSEVTKGHLEIVIYLSREVERIINYH